MVDPEERERVLEKIREICLGLPETSERLSHGAPTFFVRGKRAFTMVLSNHHGDGRFAIWCAAPDGKCRRCSSKPIRSGSSFRRMSATEGLGVRLDRGLD